MAKKENGEGAHDRIALAGTVGTSDLSVIEGAKTDTERTETPQEAIRRNVIEVLDLDDRVNFVLAMGSSAEGKEGRYSDIDICVVMRDDVELNEILGELPELFAKLGKLVGFYKYNPYHFYAVYEPATPLDIYFISPSLYFTVRDEKNKRIVDHSNRAAGSPKEKLTKPTVNAFKEGEKNETAIIKDLFLKAWIRTFRLLSKVEKNDFVTLIYILNRIRDEQIIPLLTLIKKYNIPHVKSLKLQELQEEDRALITKTFPGPERTPIIDALHTTADLLQQLYAHARTSHDMTDLDVFVANVYKQIKEYA